MNAALQKIVVPHLRNKGFKGSLPHFRRLSPTGTDLLTFQFRLGGGAFVVEVAHKEPYIVSTEWGNHIPPEKLTAHDLNKRLRIGRDVLGITDPWFDFSSGNYDELADKVCTALTEAERCWNRSHTSSLPADESMSLNARRAEKLRATYGKRVFQDIRRVLFWEWDPIGVKDLVKEEDEYDAYIGPIYHLLASGASDQSLAEFLKVTERETMGLNPGGDNERLRIVKLLRQLDLSDEALSQ